MIRLVLGALALSPTFAGAFTFSGDWEFSYSVELTYNVAFGSGSQTESASTLVNVSQIVEDEFSFPLTLGPISGQGDFIVNGLQVTDTNSGQTTNPFQVNISGTNYTVRATYPTWNLTGTITGVNNSLIQPFGAYAYSISGSPTTILNIQLEALIGGLWINLGNNNQAEITNWDLNRDAVPEPATIVIFVGMIAALKRRSR